MYRYTVGGRGYKLIQFLTRFLAEFVRVIRFFN